MSKGVGEWTAVCPYCEQIYHFTNFMRRRKDPDLDTHRIGCRKRHGAPFKAKADTNGLRLLEMDKALVNEGRTEER